MSQKENPSVHVLTLRRAALHRAATRLGAHLQEVLAKSEEHRGKAESNGETNQKFDEIRPSPAILRSSCWEVQSESLHLKESRAEGSGFTKKMIPNLPSRKIE